MRLLALMLLATLGSGCRCGPESRSSEGRPPAERQARPTATRPVTAPPTVAASPTMTAPPTMIAPPIMAPGPGSTPAGVARPQPPPAVSLGADPVAVPPGFRLRGGRLDIDVHRTEVRALLQAIARATRTNLILYGDVQGKVTVQLRNQPVRSALEVVARAVGCRVTEAGRMLIVRCN